MNVKPIAETLPEEHIVAVYPTMAPQVEDYWPRRLNLYTGRALSDLALQTEQNVRAGRLAMLAQTVSSGVVHGLEVGLARGSEAGRDYLHVAAGVGITFSGEDVRVPKAHRVNVARLPVYGPADLRGGTDVLEGLRPSLGALRPRFLLDPLEEILSGDGAASVPPVSILVLQPIVAELLGRSDPEDPCERDPQNDAFADWQLADGARFVLYPWPTEWLPLPPRGDQWRNRLAHAVFEQESGLVPPQVMPWNEVGVAIGLIAFDEEWRPEFVDRSAVVRAGGKPRRGAVADLDGTMGVLPPNAADPFSWQARIEQFAEEIVAAGDEITMLELAAKFRYLPPAGILPKGAVNPRGGRTSFFPSSYHVDVVPIPLEQLDVVIRESASLRRFDLGVPDRVRILVPVPQVWYEPRLLEQEEVNPEFDTALNGPGGFVERRNEWLTRREDVRVKASALQAALAGEPRAFPDPDPDALEDEDSAARSVPLDPPEEPYGTAEEEGALVISAIQELKTALESAVVAGELTEEVEGEGSVDRIEALGLAKFIEQLMTKVDQADDLVDMSFVRVQADIYRVRQLMLGSSKASRLATSPALAAIAKGESAVATVARINDFFSVLRAKG